MGLVRYSQFHPVPTALIPIPVPVHSGQSRSRLGPAEASSTEKRN